VATHVFYGPNPASSKVPAAVCSEAEMLDEVETSSKKEAAAIVRQKDITAPPRPMNIKVADVFGTGSAMAIATTLATSPPAATTMATARTRYPTTRLASVDGGRIS
jgi:hypothetical protein